MLPIGNHLQLNLPSSPIEGVLSAYIYTPASVITPGSLRIPLVITQTVVQYAPAHYATAQIETIPSQTHPPILCGEAIHYAVTSLGNAFMWWRGKSVWGFNTFLNTAPVTLSKEPPWEKSIAVLYTGPWLHEQDRVRANVGLYIINLYPLTEAYRQIEDCLYKPMYIY